MLIINELLPNFWIGNVDKFSAVYLSKKGEQYGKKRVPHSPESKAKAALDSLYEYLAFKEHSYQRGRAFENMLCERFWRSVK